GLVGELAEVDLPRMRRLGQHADIGPSAEDLLLAAGEDDRTDGGVLEPQPLHDVVELDVDPEVVGVELQLVPVAQRAPLVHVHDERGDRPLHGESPVAVSVGIHPELDPVTHHSMFYTGATMCQGYVA